MKIRVMSRWCETEFRASDSSLIYQNELGKCITMDVNAPGSINTHSIVLCEEQFVDTASVEKALQGTTVSLTKLATLEALQATLKAHPDSVLLCSHEQLSGANSGRYQDILGLAKKSILLSYNDKSSMKDLGNNTDLSGVIAENSSRFTRDFMALTQLVGPRGLLIKEIIKNPIEMLHLKVRDYADKDRHLKILEEKAASLGCFKDFPKFALTCGWELMMNAILDVTYEDIDLTTANHLWSQDILLGINEEITLSFGYDSEQLAISVKDNFGSLKPNQIKKVISDCFQEKREVNLEDGQGAGIGLYMVMRYAHGLHFMVQPGVSTEIVAVINRSTRMLTYRKQLKTINFISLGE